MSKLNPAKDMKFNNAALFKKGSFLAIFFIIFVIGLIFYKKFYGMPFKDVVKVYGKVYYNDYTSGHILVFWRKEIIFGSPKPDSNPVLIKKVPEKYCIYVPKNIGSFYVCAKCNLADGIVKENSIAYFTSDLITINPKKNKIRVDVYLTKRQKIMDYYKGQTVKISGKVIQENYAKGPVVVAVETPENHKKIYWPPDIAQTIFPGPGNYSIDVPVNIGKAYVNAWNYPEKNYAGDMPGVIFSGYKDNPISIVSSDIENVDIILE